MTNGLMVRIFGDSISISSPAQAGTLPVYIPTPSSIPGPTHFYIELLLALNKKQKPGTQERLSHGQQRAGSAGR